MLKLMIAEDETTLNDDLDRFRDLSGVEELHSLPAKKLYKIKVRFRQL